MVAGEILASVLTHEERCASEPRVVQSSEWAVIVSSKSAESV